jgi:ribosomal protein L25 (general stress protein Ctc)
MNSDLLQVSIRAPQSKAKQLRRQGYVPGVLYGRNTTTTPVLFNKNHVENFIKRVGEGTVFDIELDGIKQTVRIREMQRDPISKEIIHLDLMNVDLDQEIKINVAQITENINRYSSYLKQQEIDSLNKAINKLREALKIESLPLPGKDEPFYTELPPFLTDKVLAEIDNLKNTYESIFDADFWDSVNRGPDNGNGNEDGDTDNDDDNSDNQGNNNNRSGRRGR